MHDAHRVEAPKLAFQGMEPQMRLKRVGLQVEQRLRQPLAEHRMRPPEPR